MEKINNTVASSEVVSSVGGYVSRLTSYVSRLTVVMLLCLTAAPARAFDISDYTAYPPFLPRVVSPNILFMLDYSKSMVRPAYGNCKSVSDYSDAGADDAGSDLDDTDISDCRNTFNQTGVGEITLAGTVSVTLNSAAVTGTGTQFSSQLSAGNTIRIKNVDYTISSIASSTSLTLSSNYRGTTESGLTAYKVGTLTGTISVTNGSTTVTGTGTSFSTELAAGGTIILRDVPYTISSIESNTSLTLASSYSGTTESGFSARKGDAYSKVTPYSGYFDNGYPGSGSYLDSSSFKYNCTAGTNGLCVKDSNGSWNGNWLNWLTTTQFDIMKKVTVGGDVNPAPEQSAPSTVRSILTDGYTFRKTMVLKDGDTNSNGVLDYCEGKVPDSLCKKWPTVTYGWKTVGVGETVTTVFGSTDADDEVSTRQLPFPFTFYGNTYTNVCIDTNGLIRFVNPGDPCSSSQSFPINTDLPVSTPNNFIAPYWDDLQVCVKNSSGCEPSAGVADSAITYFTTGTAPTRIFVITYGNMMKNGKDDLVPDTGKSNPLTFQVLLYEGSNHIVFQYSNVQTGQAFGAGKTATVGVDNNTGTAAKKYSYNGSTLLSYSQAIFATPHISFTVTPRSGTTDFQVAAPLNGVSSGLLMSGSNPAGYKVEITVNENSSCTSEGVGCYYNRDRAKYYDHPTLGLLQDFRDGELGGTLGFRLAIEQLNDTDGGTVVKHFNQKEGMGTGAGGWPSLMNDTRKQQPQTITNTPLAEALQTAIGYFKQDTSFRVPTTATSSQSWTNHGTGSTCAATGTNYDPYCFQSAAQRVSCCKSFVLLVSSGNYSNDNKTNIYGDADDSNGTLLAGAMSAIDGGSLTSGTTGEGTKLNGGYLDNVAYKAHTTDWRSDLEATQNITLYVVNTFGEGSGEGTAILKKAAKYGGFDDSLGATTDAYDASVSGNCTPAKGEDDRNCDGVPDTYFEASGGSDLKSKIISAVMDIMKSSASGTSVSVLSTSAGGEGAIYQAYFYPARIEGTTEERTWPGFLRAFFLDKYENLRDDSGGGSYQNCPGTSCAFSGTTDAKLIMANDRVAQMYLDTTTNEVKAKMILDPDGIPPFADPQATVTMDQIASIWEGGKNLALRDKSTRKIFTWLNTGGTTVSTTTDGFSSIGGTPLDFTTGNVSTLKPYLRAGTADVDGTGPYVTFTADQEAGYIVRFVRGEAITPTTTSLDNTGVSYRNRCISISGATAETGCTGNQRVWALGDVVYSTPSLVSGPGEQYDLLYGDANYKNFRAKYQNRRRMVYVGANDGMLHAFNAGVYTPGDNCDGTTGEVESGCFKPNPTSGNGWTLPTTPAIGDELWAFIPHDNLPHLAWLACNGTAADPTACGGSEYTHVFYVDSRPKVTDARIFNNSGSADCPGSATGLIDGQAGACHPGGWGTIMIMSMRLGGGAMDVEIDGVAGTSTGEQFRSAYYAFDITDPEKKPRLLWRFYDSALGFTTSYPAIAKICYDSANPNTPPNPCTPGGTVTEKWYMVVGNGSNNLIGTQASGIRDYGGNSTTLEGKVFVVDLTDGSLDKTLTVESTSTTYMGDPLVVDENFDFTSDVIYVGSSIQSSGSLTVSGKVYRINTDGKLAADWRSSVLYNTTKPVLTPPSVATDSQRNLWVFFGTGRLRNTDDLTNSEQQTFYGIKDACGKKGAICTDTYTASQLANTTGSAVTLSTQGVTGVAPPTGCVSCTIPTSYNALLSLMRGTDVKGWYLNLNDPTTPSERVLSRAGVLGGVVLFTTYTPVSNMCSIFGDSRLYALNYETGTAYSKAIVGTTSETTGIGTSTSTTTGTYVSKAVELGKGMPTAVGIAVGEKLTGFVQKSTGEIVRIEAEPGMNIRSGAASWREKTGGGGTSEIETIYKHIVK